jgi:predicted transcriptional regulator
MAGRKTFELRKRAPPNPSALIVYATSPISAIVAVGDVDRILRGSPESLWRRIGLSSGCTRKEFFDYFSGTEVGAAMQLTRMVSISPLPLVWLREQLEWHPPVSWMKASEQLIELVEKQ